MSSRGRAELEDAERPPELSGSEECDSMPRSSTQRQADFGDECESHQERVSGRERSLRKHSGPQLDDRAKDSEKWWFTTVAVWPLS